MFERYRVVCVTPAGRRRYLRILVPQVLASPLVDEYHLWVNTTDPSDIAFLHELQAADSRIRVIEPTLLPPGLTTSIRQFYGNCVDDDTIYVRFDDDIVFIEPGFFQKFLRFRVDNPQYFVVFPNTINNAVCTYLQMMRGAIDPGARLHPWCMDVTAWGNPRFAEQLHRAFLASVEAGDVSGWHFESRLIALARFSINCMAWFGREFAKFGGVVMADEEEYLSVVRPTEIMTPNGICGDAIVSHFAFMPQRQYLDSTDLLQRYAFVADRAPRPAHTHSRPAGTLDLWTPRLLEAIDRIASASDSDLKRPEFVADCVRHAGLILDRRFLYGSDNRYANTEKVGLWQMPMQLARCLVQLSHYEIASVMDVGTATGWTASIVAAYLSRFNPDLHVVTLDVSDGFECYPAVRQRLPIEFRPGKSSKDCVGEFFDLVFMRADKTYEGCRGDYEAVGGAAPLCALHDINDRFVSAHAANDGGVPRFWKELKSQANTPDEIFEFLDHSHNERVMGIGLLVRGSAGRRSGIDGRSV
jgi:hypothetical protein